jgi:putative addiction module component (TIGR02574 family)
MSSQPKSLIREVLQLSPAERAALVDTLIMSLDAPDAVLDAEWLREAETRMAAYKAGKLNAVDAEHVFSEMEQIG